MENFEARVIAKKIEDFIDSCKPIDWEIYENKKRELKNPNAEIQETNDDYEFVNQCYKKILNMHDMTPDKDEVKHWINFINQQGNKIDFKNRLVNTFRQTAAQKNAEINPMKFEELLDKNDKKRVLLALKESLGDHYILTSLLPEIKSKYPDHSIYIGCEQQYVEIYDLNPYVKKVLPWIPDMDNEMKMVGFANHNGLFDVYINVATSTQKLLNYLSNQY